MEYYIQGNAANADKIRAAFEKLGYDTGNLGFTSSQLYYTTEGKVELMGTIALQNLIKTHPDYQELELTIEPKFKVGDWIANDYCAGKVIALTDEAYLLDSGQGIPFSCEHNAHLWTIADAKDGDILATNGIICIFKKLDKDGYYIISPCIYTVKDGLEVIDDEADSIGSYGFKPATKEDRKLLFRKMKEAGYTWDAEKKELKKVQPHYDIANFKEGVPVLVREYDTCVWQWVLYSHFNGVGLFFAAGKTWRQCIPFNKDTEHLLGTTKPCGEEYINW